MLETEICVCVGVREIATKVRRNRAAAGNTATSSRISLDDISDNSEDNESWCEDTISNVMNTSIRSARIMSSSLMNTPQPHGAKEKSKRRQRAREGGVGTSQDGPEERRKKLLRSAAAVIQEHMHDELQAGEMHLQEPLGGENAADNAPHACVFGGRWRGMPAAIRHVTFHTARSAHNMSTADPEEALATALAADVTVVYSLSHPNIVATFQHNIRVAEAPQAPRTAPPPTPTRHSRTSSSSGQLIEASRSCVQLLIVQVTSAIAMLR